MCVRVDTRLFVYHPAISTGCFRADLNNTLQRRERDHLRVQTSYTHFRNKQVYSKGFCPSPEDETKGGIEHQPLSENLASLATKQEHARQKYKRRNKDEY